MKAYNTFEKFILLIETWKYININRIQFNKFNNRM